MDPEAHLGGGRFVGWMALNLIVTWHRGAMVRALVRAWNAEKAQPSQVRQRVQVDEVQSREQGARRHAAK